MGEIYDRCKQAADYIKERIDASDAIGIVLGSGLNQLVDDIEDPQIISFKDVPNFPVPTAPGHEGTMICGYLKGKKVLCMKGRFHFYEGHDMKTVVMPIRVMKLLGIRFVIMTNAAGGVNLSFKPGTLMFIDDFINFMGDNPLYGPNEDLFGVRFPDMTRAIDSDLNAKAKKIAEDLGINTRSGVYMSFRGPSFETPSEIKFARNCGADAVGVSTVPEIIAAKHCELPVIAISCITNMGAGITGEKLTLEEVEETANLIKEDFRRLLEGIVENC